MRSRIDSPDEEEEIGVVGGRGRGIGGGVGGQGGGGRWGWREFLLLPKARRLFLFSRHKNQSKKFKVTEGYELTLTRIWLSQKLIRIQNTADIPECLVNISRHLRRHWFVSLILNIKIHEVIIHNWQRYVCAGGDNCQGRLFRLKLGFNLKLVLVIAL